MIKNPDHFIQGVTKSAKALVDRLQECFTLASKITIATRIAVLGPYLLKINSSLKETSSLSDQL